MDERMSLDLPERPVLDRKHALQVPEILTLILENLKRDKVDLIIASRVSRHFRAVAQPILFREMSVPLSRVPEMVPIFKPRRSRALLQHVKALRLWDDEAHNIFKFEEHSQSVLGSRQFRRRKYKKRMMDQRDQSDKEECDPRWTQEVYEFLDLLTWSRTHPLPFLDLSFGVVSSLALHRLISEIPEFAERVTALRVLSDFPCTTAAVHDWSQWDANIGTWWKSLGSLLQNITSAQDRASSSVLKVFTMECYEGNLSRRRTIRPDLWQVFQTTLSPRIEDLTFYLTLSDNANDNADGDYKTLLRANWPRLRRFRLVTPAATPPWNGWLESVEDFLERHPRLEELDIRAPPSAPSSIPALSLSQTFPNLKRAFVHTDTISTVKSFLSRHPKLVDFGIDPLQDDDGIDYYALTDVPEALPALQTILSHEIEFQAFILADLPNLARSVQSRERYQRHQLGPVFHPAEHPKLTELLICSTHDDTRNPNENEIDAATRLRRSLLALQSATSLRVLHIEYSAAQLLPIDSHLNEELACFPPSLEFISWHSPQNNRTQYYRVQGGVVRSIPASFRLRVDNHGVWNESSDLRMAKVLLDHSVFPPRLLA
ncbi:unnamed protein product [Tilletia laevis]|nr:unnamed protein product [Tilletia laevis]